MKLDSYIGVKLLKNFIYVAKQKTKKKFPLIHLKLHLMLYNLIMQQFRSRNNIL